MYVYVCLYIYIYIHIHVYKYIFICVYTYANHVKRDIYICDIETLTKYLLLRCQARRVVVSKQDLQQRQTNETN